MNRGTAQVLSQSDTDYMARSLICRVNDHSSTEIGTELAYHRISEVPKVGLYVGWLPIEDQLLINCRSDVDVDLDSNGGSG